MSIKKGSFYERWMLLVLLLWLFLANASFALPAVRRGLGTLMEAARQYPDPRAGTMVVIVSLMAWCLAIPMFGSAIVVTLLGKSGQLLRKITKSEASPPTRRGILRGSREHRRGIVAALLTAGVILSGAVYLTTRTGVFTAIPGEEGSPGFLQSLARAYLDWEKAGSDFVPPDDFLFFREAEGSLSSPEQLLKEHHALLAAASELSVSGEEKCAVDGGTSMSLTSVVYYFFGMQSVSFDRAGRLLASNCSDGTFKVWDVEAGREAVSDSTERRLITALDLGPADDLVALGYSDGTVRIMSLGKSNDLLALRSKHGSIIAIALSPDMQFLAILSSDQTLTLWQIASETETVFQDQGGTGLGFSVCESSTCFLAFTANSSVLVSSGSDRATILWNVQERKQIGRMRGSPQWAALAPNGDLLAIARGEVIELWNASMRKRVRKLRKHRARISAGTFDRNGQYLVTGCEDGTINLWNVTTGTKLWDNPDHGEAVTSLGASPDGRFLVSGSRSGVVQLLSLNKRKKIWSEIGHAGAVMSVMFSSSGKFFVSHSREDGTVLLWDVEKIVGNSDEIEKSEGHDAAYPM